MLRTETMNPMGDMMVIVEQGINGEKLLRSQRTLNGPPGAIIRVGAAPAGDAELQIGASAGISINPAPCALAIRNDQRTRPKRPVCIPTRTRR